MLKEKIKQCLLEKLVYPQDTSEIQQRGIADIFEKRSCDALKETFSNTQDARGKKSTEDIMVENCYVDIKTSDVAGDMNMPNLISVNKLLKIDKPLYYVIIKYDSKQNNILDVLVLNVYDLNWDHLGFGNLGTGQMQIKNMEKFYESPTTDLSEAAWKKKFKEHAILFYQHLIEVTQKRIKKLQE